MSWITDLKFLNTVALSNHKFMVNLYRVLATEDENLFFSPFSVYVALILVYLGSKGDTANELRKSLFASENEEYELECVQKLLNDLKHPELNIATEIFVEKSYKLRTKYEDDAKKFVCSKARLVDFKTAARTAENLINSWVSSQTNNKINDLIPAGSLDETTRLVLVNAIHFKDNWFHQFEKNDTYKEKFFKTENNFDDVDMMHLTKHFRYAQEESFQVLELPYKNTGFKMVIFLPNEIDGLPVLEQALPSLDILAILSRMFQEKVKVTFPKFKLENFINLSGALQTMGIEAMFDERKADLTGVHEPTTSPLVVTHVLQKAFIEVNEEGTEAAAATAVFMGFGCAAGAFREKLYHFTVNHPFIFLLLFKNTPLFMGKQVSII